MSIKIKKALHKLKYGLFWAYTRTYKNVALDYQETSLSTYQAETEIHSGIGYEIVPIDASSVARIGGKMWTGAHYVNGCLYGICNSAEGCLKFCLRTHELSIFGCLPKGEYKWTGGCIYKNRIYGFPRASNDLLIINPETEEVIGKSLGLSYTGEHHYGGVCTKQGTVFQPPRNEDHILRIDLNTLETKKIPCTPRHSRVRLRYAGALLHPNGLIYMMPEGKGRVMVLDPQTDALWYIGSVIKASAYGAAVGIDGNIYGFNGHSDGILKIDIRQNQAEIICPEIGNPGCYGTKAGLNGRLYGIPGDGSCIWELDVRTQKVKPIYEIAQQGNAKCAGGIVTEEGVIYSLPTSGSFIYQYVPQPDPEFVHNGLSEDVYSEYYVDSY